MHTYNLRTQEAEAGGCQVLCQPGLYSEFKSSVRGVLCLSMSCELVLRDLSTYSLYYHFLKLRKSPEFSRMIAVRVPASGVLDGNTVSSG